MGERPDAAEVDAEREKQLAKEYLRRNLRILVVAVVIILGLAMLAKWLLGEQLDLAIHYLTDRFGYAGPTVAVWIIDTFTLPISPDFILAVIAHPGSRLDPVLALSLISVASMVAGMCAYSLARLLAQVEWVQRRLARSSTRGHALFSRYGVWAVVIAGLTPIPFSIVCWLAGLYRMRPLPLALATVSRIPRMVAWFFLLRAGFSI